MQVELRYFADAREAAGTDREQVAVRDGETVADVLDAACVRHPTLVEVRARCRVAVDEAFASEQAPLHDGATVALIPPVGGG